jgi:hypothetical protein
LVQFPSCTGFPRAATTNWHFHLIPVGRTGFDQILDFVPQYEFDKRVAFCRGTSSLNAVYQTVPALCL